MANHTILLIDYEPRSIERFRQPLVGAGYAVEIATDGITGIEAFTRLNPDMVLVEAMIPKKHGFEVCQELKRTPHGRRTPIIITTGVYKGRKYRTQALHIYGCDEYIEKPIAAEQLLAIVERFLGGTSPSSREPVAAAVEATEADASASTSAEAPRVASEPASHRPAPHKQNTIPKAVVADLTEDEIMARLDAILPGAAPEMAPAPAVIAIAPEPPVVEELPAEIEIVSEPTAGEDVDPFGRMQAELSAELGSLSTALALDPAPQILEPIPEPMASDQAAAPSLLEALPEPDMTEPFPVEAPASVPSPGQVVNFDVKRSRKNKKGGKKAQPERAEGREPAAESKASKSESRTSEMNVPSGSLVESALDTPRPARGIPAWVWIALGAVALAVVYFVFLRGDARTSRLEPAPVPAPRSTPAPPAPAETVVAEVEPPPAPETTATPSESKLVLNAVGPRPAKAAPMQAPQPAMAKPAPKPVVETPSAPAVSDSVAPPVAAPAAPAGIDDAGAGVEAITNTAAPESKRPTTAPGALIDIVEADTDPVSLSRKLPVYSMQARQLRLQGTIVMKVLVNENGGVDQVLLVSGVDGADLNDAALKAAKQWTYRPATKDGVPVKVWKTEQVAFKL